MHHQCIVLSISELQRIDDLCINAVIYAGLESSCSRFGGLAKCEVLTVSVGSRFARSSLQLSRWEEFGDAGDNAYLCRHELNIFQA